jgi:ribosomal protein S18 acetylase RimI-like enzyme
MHEPRPFCLRKASHDDARSILVCLQEAFSPYRDAYTPAAYRDTVLSPDLISERLSRMTVHVATDDAGEVIGTIGYHLVGMDEGHLRGMAVLPAWQGRGLADGLLTQVVDDLRERGCSRVSLGTTRVLERAIRFYERNGFRRSGKVEDFFGMELFEYARRIEPGAGA